MLNLFEGKISLQEIKDMDYSLLIALKDVKEKKTVEENDRLQREKQAQTQMTTRY